MADPDRNRVEIGRLRWTVVIAKRDMKPVAGGGSQDTITPIITVHADVQPTGALTFYSGVQVDTPVTHKITVRWLDWLDTTFVVLRDTRRQDGSIRSEIFRIRRVKEIDGRKRFAELEVELEKRQ